jgi:hypothetical protein
MAKKKKDSGAKRAEQLQGLLRKAGPMKHRNCKRRPQKERRYDESSEK